MSFGNLNPGLYIYRGNNLILHFFREIIQSNYLHYLTLVTRKKTFQYPLSYSLFNCPLIFKNPTSKNILCPPLRKIMLVPVENRNLFS